MMTEVEKLEFVMEWWLTAFDDGYKVGICQSTDKNPYEDSMREYSAWEKGRCAGKRRTQFN